MHLKSLAIAALTSVASLSANAAFTSPVQVTGPSFSDIELGSIALLVTSNVVGAVGYAPYVLIAPGFQISLPPVTFNSVVAQRTSDGFTTGATLTGAEFSFSGLTSGTYYLRTSGTLTGTNFVAAEYTLITTAIPEPESFALLLAGLGLVGAVTQHRKKHSVA